MDENLKKQAEVIRDETKRNGNTAHRVGSFFLDLLKYISDPEGIPYAKSAKADWKGNVIDETYVVSNTSQAVRKIDFKDIDSLMNVFTSLGYYNVYNGLVPIGELIVTGDNMRHTVIQFMFSNYSVEDQGLLGSHRDNLATIVYRIYNSNSPSISDIPRGTWGKWKKYGQNYQVLAEADYEALVDKNPSIFYYTYENEEEAV